MAALGHSSRAFGLVAEGEEVSCQSVCDCSDANEQLKLLIGLLNSSGCSNKDLAKVMVASKHTKVFDKAFRSLSPITNDAELMVLQNLCTGDQERLTELRRLRSRAH